MHNWLFPDTLTGDHVVLHRITDDASIERAALALDPEGFQYLSRWPMAYNMEGKREFLLSLLKLPNIVAYCVNTRTSGIPVGISAFLDATPEHRRLEIGWTVFHPSQWGRCANPEAKLLMLTHAFEVLAVQRVEFTADERNQRSRKALKNIGAKYEGTKRKVTVTQSGFCRSSCFYSILDAEWPGSKTRLQHTISVRGQVTLQPSPTR